MILNVRGSSCSGKSTNCYNLIRDYGGVEVWERVGWNKVKPRQVGHLLPGGLFIVGPYATTAKTGGMDMLMPGKTELVTLWLERNCQRYPFVIFESMMASLAIGRYHELRKRLGPPGTIQFAFMDTPMETCRERIMARNGGLGPSGKGINDEATVVHQWHRIRQIKERLLERHEVCYDLDWQDSYRQVLALLQQGGWDPASTAPFKSDKVRTRYTLQDVWTELFTVGYPDADPDRIKRFNDEIAKHKGKFES